MNCENSHTEESSDSISIEEDSVSEEFELIDAFMALSDKAIMRNAAKDLNHDRTRWFKIEDKKAGTKPRYELVYMIGKHNKQTEYAQVRRMNDQVHPTYLHLKSAKKQPPSTSNYNSRDLQWFLHHGFQSFINYQANRQDDVSGAVFEERKIPAIKKKKYETELQQRDKEIQSLRQQLKKAVKTQTSAPPDLPNKHSPMQYLQHKLPRSNATKSAKRLVNTTQKNGDDKQQYVDYIDQITKQHEEALMKRVQEIQFMTESASNFQHKYNEEQKRNEQLQFQLTEAQSINFLASNFEQKYNELNEELQMQLTENQTTNFEVQDLNRKLQKLRRERDEAINKFERLEKQMQLIAGLGSQKHKIENNVQTKCRNDTDDSKQQLIEQYERVNQEQHQTFKDLEHRFNAQAKAMEQAEREISELREQLNNTERTEKPDDESSGHQAMPQDLIDVLTNQISDITAKRDELSKTL
eukprot:1082478_1